MWITSNPGNTSDTGNLKLGSKIRQLRCIEGRSKAYIGPNYILRIQLFFLGVVGEYVGAIFTYVQNRPLVVEKERINFEE